jgi:hypothetical protein
MISNSQTYGIESQSDLSCAMTQTKNTKKDTYFTAPSGKKYIIYEDRCLNDSEADTIYK